MNFFRPHHVALTLPLLLAACGGSEPSDGSPVEETPDSGSGAAGSGGSDASTQLDGAAGTGGSGGEDASRDGSGGAADGQADAGGEDASQDDAGDEADGSAGDGGEDTSTDDASDEGDGDSGASDSGAPDADATSAACAIDTDCSSGQRCDGGLCVCDATSCSTGCCTQHDGGVCVAGTDRYACGTGGKTCGDCSKLVGTSGQCGTISQTCINVTHDGTCGGEGGNHVCKAGQRCGAGNICVCDATSCASGCCTQHDWGECRAGNEKSACGTGGGTCQECNADKADACTGGACTCKGAPACSGTDVCKASSGCTADLDADPKNCGTMGHDCLGGACKAGKCQPVVMFETSNGTPLRIALDGNHVYWTDPTLNGVFRLDKTATAGSGATWVWSAGEGAPVNSAWGIATAGDPTLNDVGVWVTNRAAGKVILVGYDGTGSVAHSTSSSNDQPYDIVCVDGQNGCLPYWTDYGTNRIERLVPDGNGGLVAQTFTVTNTSGVTGIASASGNLYWTEYAGSASTMSITGATVTKYTGYTNDESRFIVSNGLQTFWNSASGNAIYGATSAGASASVITSSEKYPEGLAVDSSGLYWVNFKCSDAEPDCVRWRRPTAPFTISTIATYQDGPSDIATDAKAIYWVNRGTKKGNGQVVRLAK